ncbi:MAG: LysR family transcriptional regulator, partial [Pseudomonadota bacterium]|nr:LysR family transcriptional regulator [Pseudomonadota bacterium]
TVVATGSFTAAADRLNLSKAMVSRQVFNLEKHLATRLLNRTTRRLSLTESGAAYHERCLQIISDVEEAEQVAAQMTQIPRGSLKVTIPVAFGLHKLGQLMAEYTALHPQVRLDISLSDRYVDLVEEGFDLAIRIGRLPESDLVARKLGVTRSIICASPTYLEQHGYPMQPEDLIHHSCLGYTYTNSGTEWRFRNQEAEKTIPVSGAIKANNGDLLRLAALNGAGLVYQPLFIVEKDLQSGKLVQVLNTYTSDEFGIYALYPSRKYLSAKVRTFVEFLVAKLVQPSTLSSK